MTKVAIRVIAVKFICSLKMKQRVNSHTKSTKIIRVSTSFMSLLLAMRTSTVTTALQKVTTITSTHNLPFVSKIIMLLIFFCLEQTTRPQFLLLTDFITCLPPEKLHPSLTACKDGGYPGVSLTLKVEGHVK